MTCPRCNTRPCADGRARCFECMEAEMRAIAMPRYPHTTTEPVNPDRFRGKMPKQRSELVRHVYRVDKR